MAPLGVISSRPTLISTIIRKNKHVAYWVFDIIPSECTDMCIVEALDMFARYINPNETAPDEASSTLINIIILHWVSYTIYTVYVINQVIIESYFMKTENSVTLNEMAPVGAISSRSTLISIIIQENKHVLYWFFDIIPSECTGLCKVGALDMFARINTYKCINLLICVTNERTRRLALMERTCRVVITSLVHVRLGSCFPYSMILYQLYV